jgi:hypothetical protein
VNSFDVKHIQKFNQRVQVMNNTSSRELVLGAREARDLQAEILSLLTQLAQAQQSLITQESNAVAQGADGGKF